MWRGLKMKISAYQVLKTQVLIRGLEKLLHEVEQNVVICQWQADQVFAEAEG